MSGFSRDQLYQAAVLFPRQGIADNHYSRVLGHFAKHVLSPFCKITSVIERFPLPSRVWLLKVVGFIMASQVNSGCDIGHLIEFGGCPLAMDNVFSGTEWKFVLVPRSIVIQILYLWSWRRYLRRTQEGLWFVDCELHRGMLESRDGRRCCAVGRLFTRTPRTIAIGSQLSPSKPCFRVGQDHEGKATNQTQEQPLHALR